MNNVIHVCGAVVNAIFVHAVAAYIVFCRDMCFVVACVSRNCHSWVIICNMYMYVGVCVLIAINLCHVPVYSVYRIILT